MQIVLKDSKILESISR